ncbi:phospholipase D-like domain-containing protein [Neorhizobium alkalisoli]|uniref:phospholipase D-like domain-containing protein n=1 Tax=Neorhizobium alkalisoli TaxID=528178 RepID=UPI001319ED23|nr:phospholipase D-like domain-containing protein [Neorhizobium alkalisoli]
MAQILKAVAIANNEVAYLAWDIDTTAIPGCLGFHIVREYLDDNDQVTEERPLASYVAFKGQSNPEWQAQNTSVWPVQKFNWRDLTLRKKRNEAQRRPDNERVRYRIRAVGKMKAELDPVEVVPESHRDFKTRQIVQHTYEGKPIPLGYLTPAAFTNVIDVTTKRLPFTSSFTNGILSTQFLSKVLNEDGTISPNELENHLRKPGDWLRNYLAGDVLPILHDFFAQPGGRFHAALYELEDVELLKLLTDNAARLDLILSDAGSGQDEDAEPNEKGKQPTIYDTRNAPARAVLRAIADIPGSGCTLRNRLFNGTGHIGHNKFVVWLDDGGTPRSVITGSTNWTWSGVAGQSNNCVRIDDDAIAGAYFEYWTQLKADKLPEPTPLNAKAKGATQGDTLKKTNRTPSRVALPNGASAEIWFSPNMPGKKQPPSKSAKPALPPPDMDRLFSLLRKAEKAIFFLVFMPSRGGVNSVVSEAIALGLKDTSLNVVGAISDTQAMWGYEPSQELPSGKKLPAWSPHVFQQAGISVIRATALTDREIGRAVGDFKNDETLTLGRAIIHDKVLVIDPMDPEKCVVAFGSHNFGYKASYSNDENLIIVEGHAALAQAYAAHVLDVYDHYRFRAAEAEVTAHAKKHGAAGGKSDPRWDGFLDTTDDWQKRASHRMSAYFTR